MMIQLAVELFIGNESVFAKYSSEDKLVHMLDGKMTEMRLNLIGKNKLANGRACFD